jgi:hypothetical protein
MDTICNLCNAKITNKKDLLKHQRTKKCQEINIFVTSKNNILKDEIIMIKNALYEIEKENLNLKNEVLYLKSENKEKDNLIKNLYEKSEEYRKIVENYSLNYMKENNFVFKKEKDTIQNTTFEIDINLNHKQINRTKYKDVSEDIVKKDIQSLKLKDNYILEYREEDGYINVTNLCKAGGKKFNDWNRLDKTKKFLDVLSSSAGIPVNEIIKYESGSIHERSTWAHPQVAINIAQWISPEFDVLVSKWVYEIMLFGKVDITENKTTQELDQMNKENKLLKNRVKILESKVLQKQPREVFENSKNVIYIVTTEYKEAQGHYKIGKTQDLQKRLSTYNTSDKHEVIYYISCKNKKHMDILEQLVHLKLEDKRIEPNKEWFLSEEDAEDFIKIIEECKNVINK